MVLQAPEETEEKEDQMVPLAILETQVLLANLEPLVLAVVVVVEQQ